MGFSSLHTHSRRRGFVATEVRTCWRDSLYGRVQGFGVSSRDSVRSRECARRQSVKYIADRNTHSDGAAHHLSGEEMRKINISPRRQ